MSTEEVDELERIKRRMAEVRDLRRPHIPPETYLADVGFLLRCLEHPEGDSPPIFSCLSCGWVGPENCLSDSRCPQCLGRVYCIA